VKYALPDDEASPKNTGFDKSSVRKPDPISARLKVDKDFEPSSLFNIGLQNPAAKLTGGEEVDPSSLFNIGQPNPRPT